MLDKIALETLFEKARTHSAWLDKPVAAELLRKIYNLAKFGPTSANCSPMRVIFVQSSAAKEKLKPCLAPGNIDKTMSAPVTAIIGYDMEFYEHLPQLFPHTDARSWFVGNEQLIMETAFRNASLQAAYLILAARSCGLDCGPMSGFDANLIDQQFFAGTNIKSTVLCNLGYGDHTQLHPRNPRFEFEDVCQII